MSRIISTSLLLVFVTVLVSAQTEIKTLPANINRASINLFAPFISGDGQTLVYLSDYSDDGHHTMTWTTKKTVSTWNDGVQVNRLINRPTLNFRGGYCLSFDGDVMYFTSMKSGIGGFDIWSSNRRGNDWEAPKNLGKPLNTTEHEGSPSISPDGEYLYFMRCETMKPYGGATGCQLMVSKKSYNGWTEAVALPANINTGNSQTPRIMADGETLIFSSDKMGGKGKLDLFITRKTGKDQWSDPVNLEFANTEYDDPFVSVAAKGRYMFKAVKGARDNELVELLIPKEFQPKSVMRIQGKITDENGNPLNARLTVFNIDERDRLWNENVGNSGEFAIVLNEGSAYDLSVSTDNPDYMYYSKLYDLEEIGPRDKQRLSISLKPLAVGEVFPLDILFKPHSADVKEISIYELRRLGDFLIQNESLQVEIDIYQNFYQEDTVRSHEDLTETRIDTIFYKTPHINPEIILDRHDSVLLQMAKRWPKNFNTIIDSVNYSAELGQDSLTITEYKIQPLIATDSLDSLAQKEPTMQQIDTIKTSYVLDKFKTLTIYHNDRTNAQGEAIRNFLIERGVNPEQVRVAGILKKNPLPEDSDENMVEIKLKVLKR